MGCEDAEPLESQALPSENFSPKDAHDEGDTRHIQPTWSTLSQKALSESLLVHTLLRLLLGYCLWYSTDVNHSR